MDRVETNVGQEIYEWLFSKQAQNDMVGLAKVASAMLGTTGMINGLPCTQTTVPSMQISIGAGEIYQMASLEATVCGTLPVDTSDTVLKQGILLGSAGAYNLPASSTFATPGTAGQSINYLIEAQYQDLDVSVDPTTGSTPVVLNFYNSANPATPWSGPNNTGSTSATFRKGVIAWQVKAGTAATSGTQTTPTPDGGWIGLYVVTVAYGASSIVNANISNYPSAPILPSNGIVQGGFQNNYFNAAIAGGTSDALTASFIPAVTSLAIGVPNYTIRVATANLTATPTFTPNPGVIAPAVVVKGNNQALVPGDFAGAGHWADLQFDTTLAKWVLLNPATGLGVTQAQYNNSTASASTAFVKAAGLQFPAAGALGLSVNTTLTLAQLNNWAQFIAGSVTATLPLVSTVEGGATITITGGIYGGTIKGNGTDVIVPAIGGAGANTLVIGPGESVTIASNVSSWYVTSGGFGSASFLSSQAGSGYQKLPGGLIIQWGAINGSGSVNTAATFPIAFPNVCYSVTQTALNPSNYVCTITAAPTTTGFTFNVGTTLGTASSSTAGTYYFAIGK